MRYLPILLILSACGGYAPWQDSSDTIISFGNTTCERFGVATTDLEPQGRTQIHIMADSPQACGTSYTDAIVDGLRQLGQSRGGELLVTEAELWEPAQEAVRLYEAEVRWDAWPDPVRRVRD